MEFYQQKKSFHWKPKKKKGIKRLSASRVAPEQLKTSQFDAGIYYEVNLGVLEMVKQKRKNTKSDASGTKNYFKEYQGKNYFYEFAKVSDEGRNLFNEYLDIYSDAVFQKYINFFQKKFEDNNLSADAASKIFIQLDSNRITKSLNKKQIKFLFSGIKLENIYIQTSFRKRVVLDIHDYLDRWFSRNYCTAQEAACLIEGIEPERYIKNAVINHTEANNILWVIEHWVKHPEQNNLFFYLHEFYLNVLSSDMQIKKIENAILFDRAAFSVSRLYAQSIHQDQLKQYPLFLLGFERYSSVRNTKHNENENEYERINEEMIDSIKPKIHFFPVTGKTINFFSLTELAAKERGVQNITCELMNEESDLMNYFKDDIRDQEKRQEKYITILTYGDVYFINELSYHERMKWQDLLVLINCGVVIIGNTKISKNSLYIKSLSTVYEKEKKDLEVSEKNNHIKSSNQNKQASDKFIGPQRASSYQKFVAALLIYSKLHDETPNKLAQTILPMTGISVDDTPIKNILAEVEPFLREQKTAISKNRKSR